MPTVTLGAGVRRPASPPVKSPMPKAAADPKAAIGDRRGFTRAAWGRLLFGVDERLQLLDVRFIETSKQRHVVRAIDEAHRQHDIALEETFGSYHDSDQFALVVQEVADPAQPVARLAKHHVLAAVNLNLSLLLGSGLLDVGDTDPASQ